MFAFQTCSPSTTSWEVACESIRLSFLFPPAVQQELNLECRQNSPIVPGHEIIGNVAAVGAGVTAWKVGDRVGAGWHGGHDGKGILRVVFDLWDGASSLTVLRKLFCMQEGHVPDVRQPSGQWRDQGWWM